MRVLSYDPYVSADVMTAHGVEKVDLDTLMRESDFVSINCPLTDESRGMIGEAQYALMKPNAYFVTTARGNIHDEAALEAALRAKKIAGAGLDVWEKEPPPLDHPLLKYDNVMVSPHTAGVTHEARVNMGRIAAEQMLAALDGRPVARVLNPEVWPRYAARFKETFGMDAARAVRVGRLAPCLPGQAPASRSRASWVVASMSLVILGDRVRRAVDRGRGAEADRGRDRRRALGAGVCLLARLVRRRARRHRHGLARRPLRRALDRDVRRHDDRRSALRSRYGGRSGKTWQLYLGHGLFMGLLGNSGLNAPLYVYVSRWFDRRRGSALALIASGQYISGALWPPIFESAIAAYGWRSTMLVFGAVRGRR